MFLNSSQLKKDNKGFVNVDSANMMAKFEDGSVDAFQSGPWDYAAAVKAVGKDNLGVAVYPTVNIGGQEVQQKPSWVLNFTQLTKHHLKVTQNVSLLLTNWHKL